MTAPGTNPPNAKRMRLRYAGTCVECARDVASGEWAIWDKVRRVVTCLDCADVTPPVLIESAPGASLDREYARRLQRDEQRIRDRFPRLGGFLWAVRGARQSTKAFKVGAEGERLTAQRLEKLTKGEVLFLHNRRRGPRVRTGDIDHIAVAASGVYVIDPKNYRDARVRVRRTGGLLRPAREQLMVSGRDRTVLLEGLEKQRATVTEALGESSDVPVTAMLCFVGADLPLLEKLQVHGFPIVGIRGAARMLNRSGSLDPTRRREIWEQLARSLPPA